MNKLIVTSSQCSLVGKRDCNEDTIKSFSHSDLKGFILCDGLGGHGMGDIASKLVADVFEEKLSKVSSIKDYLPTAFEQAQKKLTEKQTELHAEHSMKTTAVALVTDGKKAYFGHVGDSRLYVFKKNKIIFRTLDHSVPQMLAESGMIKENEIRNHPDRNKLLSVLGIPWDEPMYEIGTPIRLRDDTSFLLCSDGFWELIDETEMCRTLCASSTVDEWLEMMIKTVEANGEGKDMDNYSAIAIWNRNNGRQA